ncbi:MAG: hypothetical protein HUJ60_03390, partial [Bacilli bacterium]|nr:hypothetical protein [Bacilli bacterium]
VDMQLEYAATHGLLERYPAIMRNCFFHLVFLNATHVWRLLGRKHGWIIKRAVDFLRNVFPDLREQREMLNASETEKNDFAMAWDDVAKYLAYHRKEMDT